MKRMKKLLAMIMCMMMALSIAVPVAADEHTHTITINETDANHNFEAYQIFKGDVAENAGNTVLSNVEWGTGIDDSKIQNLLSDLQNPGINPTYYNHYMDDTTAADVVKTLSDFNTAAHAELFAKIVGKYLASASGTLTYNNDTNYTISGLEDGYYLLKENENTTIEGKTHTDYIMQIVKDVTVTPKDGEVTVNKDIVEGTELKDACANNMGDVVEFKIVGTLPNNYDEYVEYYYAFVDTMSKGLTFVDGSVKVETLNGDDLKLIEGYYVANDTKNEDGTTTLKVEFADLVQLSNSEDFTVHASTKIVLSYKAILNQNAIIGTPGNPNIVYIEYDRSPYDEGYGRTPEDEVWVFTFELDVDKVDGHNTAIDTDDDGLAGAKFILARERSGHKQYAVLKTIQETVFGNENVTKYQIEKWTSWTSEADLDEYLVATYPSMSEEKIAEKRTELLSVYGVATEVESIKLTVKDADGNDVVENDKVVTKGFIGIEGLDLDKYWLIETKAPAGYNSIDPIQFTIDASYDKTLGRAPKEGETEPKDKLTITIGAEVKNGNTETGVVDTKVINNPGKQLPSTGGIGTTIFYVLGGVMVAGALVLLVSKKRMNA